MDIQYVYILTYSTSLHCLNYMFNKAEDMKTDGFKIGTCKRLNLHLLSLDDLIYKANLDSCERIKEMLREFRKFSWLGINLSILAIIFNKNTPNILRKIMTNIVSACCEPVSIKLWDQNSLTKG